MGNWGAGWRGPGRVRVCLCARKRVRHTERGAGERDTHTNTEERERSTRCKAVPYDHPSPLTRVVVDHKGRLVELGPLEPRAALAQRAAVQLLSQVLRGRVGEPGGGGQAEGRACSDGCGGHVGPSDVGAPQQGPSDKGDRPPTTRAKPCNVTGSLDPALPPSPPPPRPPPPCPLPPPALLVQQVQDAQLALDQVKHVLCGIHRGEGALKTVESDGFLTYKETAPLHPHFLAAELSWTPDAPRIPNQPLRTGPASSSGIAATNSMPDQPQPSKAPPLKVTRPQPTPQRPPGCQM